MIHTQTSALMGDRTHANLKSQESFVIEKSDSIRKLFGHEVDYPAELND